MSLRNTKSHSAMIVPLLAALLLPSALAARGQAQEMRRIAISVDSIRIEDEDDPLSDDEPFLIVTKFVGRLRFAGGTFTVVPGTLRVTNVMSGHNNLGRRGDNWADEVRTYSIPAGTPRIAQELVPLGQTGWVVGAVIFHLEEDGFADGTARLMGDQMRRTVETTLSGMRISGFDSAAISTAVANRIRRDLRSALARISVGGIVRGLASVADPDDFGGYQVVFGVTAAGNTVVANTAESPSDAGALLSGASTVSRERAFALRFPAGDLRSLPGNARFQGRHRVNGTIQISTQRF